MSKKPPGISPRPSGLPLSGGRRSVASTPASRAHAPFPAGSPHGAVPLAARVLRRGQPRASAGTGRPVGPQPSWDWPGRDTFAAPQPSAHLALPSTGESARPGCSGSPSRRRASRVPRNVLRAVAKQERAFGIDPLLLEIRLLLGRDAVDARIESQTDFEPVRPKGQTLEVHVEALASVGVGIARDPAHSDWAIAVPKALPGDRLRVTVVSNLRMRSEATISEVLEPSPMRTTTPACKHFHSCAGCQYQMMSYPQQLEVKRQVVDKAFMHYSGLNPALIPRAGATLPSPQQWGYRTKLTPHFELPGLVKRWREEEEMHAKLAGTHVDPEHPQLPPPPLPIPVPIGFNSDGNKKHIVDIDSCPIASRPINQTLPIQRKKVLENILSYRAGSTLLFRDSLDPSNPDPNASKVVTDMKNGVMYEKLGRTLFEGPANDFFQNNRSILLPFVEHIRQEVIRWRATLPAADRAKPPHLIDAYCGSGLFALSLAPMFKSVVGVEISDKAVDCAKKNAAKNDMVNIDFHQGSAEKIFEMPGLKSFDPDATTVVLDPPRRGSDPVFLDQLLALRPRLIIYVSCNVHTQARDVGYIFKHDPSYSIVSLRGADFFPQTHHVEGICIMERS